MYRDVLGVSLEGGPAKKIEAVIRKPRALYVKTKPWHSSQMVLEERENSIRFSWRLYLNRELKTRVMEYLPDIRIIEPAELRNWVLDSLRKVLENEENQSSES
jgi:predicted DNA-binding transcriptional regulator YafY